MERTWGNLIGTVIWGNLCTMKHAPVSLFQNNEIRDSNVSKRKSLLPSNLSCFLVVRKISFMTDDPEEVLLIFANGPRLPWLSLTSSFGVPAVSLPETQAWGISSVFGLGETPFSFISSWYLKASSDIPFRMRTIRALILHHSCPSHSTTRKHFQTATDKIL